jgi:hypothetical protein
MMRIPFCAVWVPALPRLKAGVGRDTRSHVPGECSEPLRGERDPGPSAKSAKRIICIDPNAVAVPTKGEGSAAL